jgi:Protein of unknown function (DUF3365)
MELSSFSQEDNIVIHAKTWLLASVGIAVGGLSFAAWSALNAAAPNGITSSDGAIAAARRETKMLDDLYKTAIVTVTDIYVKDESSVAAATAFRPVFKAMKDAKHHEARLVDGLGQPVGADNVPRDDFEKEAMKKMLAGEASYEKVEVVNGIPQLRTMTTLPMVMEKCILCHDNYRDKKIVGGVAYVVPIREVIK